MVALYMVENEKENDMNECDLKEAFAGGRGDWFTVLLLRLIAKADGDNRKKLRRAYPLEVKAVEIYQGDCPYLDEARNEVDWKRIERRAAGKD